MRRALLALLACPVAAAQENVDVTWLSFAQLTAERPDGGRVVFGADRVRIGVEATAGRFTGGGMLDFGVPDLDERPPGTLANVVADLYLNYRLSDTHWMRFGQFKTPLGMDFNTSGHLLDVTKRANEAGLALNRDLGAMISATHGSGFGYDIGAFNPPGRSQATRYLESQVGEDYASVGRVRYDRAAWHGEVAYGRSTNAGGPNTSDYDVADAGGAFRGRRWGAKLEWIGGKGVLGDGDRRESVYYVQGSHRLGPSLELIVRHYVGRSEVAATLTELSNTFVGFTSWLLDRPRMSGRLQVNYVFAARDTATYSGVGGYRDDILLLQFQILAQGSRSSIDRTASERRGSRL